MEATRSNPQQAIQDKPGENHLVQSSEMATMRQFELAQAKDFKAPNIAPGTKYPINDYDSLNKITNEFSRASVQVANLLDHAAKSPDHAKSLSTSQSPQTVGDLVIHLRKLNSSSNIIVATDGVYPQLLKSLNHGQDMSTPENYNLVIRAWQHAAEQREYVRQSISK